MAYDTDTRKRCLVNEPSAPSSDTNPSAPRSLNERLGTALAQTDSFAPLYATAAALRDAGLAQVDVYGIFIGLLDQHCATRDHRFDAITDVLDCIWGGGWGKAADELFASPLSEAQLGSVSVQWHEASDTSPPRVDIRLGPFSLSITNVDRLRLADMLDFCLSHMLLPVSGSLTLGTPTTHSISLSKTAESLFEFELAGHDPANPWSYRLGRKAIGEFVGGLLRATEPPDSEAQPNDGPASEPTSP